MIPITTASKTLRRLVSRQRMSKFPNHNQIRCTGGIARTSAFSSSDAVADGGHRNSNFSDYGNLSNNGRAVRQQRGFFGCTNGEEGNMLSKVHEERRVFGYSPEQLFNVVAAVDMYQDFLPWCQRSEIIQHNPDGTLDAELEIGFKFLVESYVSHVELCRPRSIKTTSYKGRLFDYLINVWEFNPGPVPGTCTLYFLVDFKLQSPFYRQMAETFFKEVVCRLVSSFNYRCQLIYGPEVPILENYLEQRA